METIKTSSNKWVNDSQFTTQKFDWQKGYGAFSHSKSQVDTVCNHIQNQEEHHKKQTFREEYLDILQKMELNTTKNTCLSFLTT